MENNFDSLDLQAIFENLPDDRKIEFLKDLQGVLEASDKHIAEIQRIIKETAEELGSK